MKRVAGAAALALITLTCLTGCVNDRADGQEAPATHYTFYQDLPNGGRVLCVWAKSGYGGGPSCDWDNATGGSGA